MTWLAKNNKHLITALIIFITTSAQSATQYREYEYINIEHFNTLWWYMYEWDVLLVV